MRNMDFIYLLISFSWEFNFVGGNHIWSALLEILKVANNQNKKAKIQ